MDINTQRGLTFEGVCSSLTFEHLISCPVCKSDNTLPAFSKIDDFFRIKFDIHRCESCTAYFVSPRIHRRHLGDLYESDYFKGESWDSDTNYLSNYGRPERLAELRRMYLRYYDQMRARIDSPNPRILDAGAGLGLFSQTVKEKHPEADIISLDPSSYAVDYLLSLGLNAVHSELETYHADMPFDCIFMREVLEHLYDPIIAITNIASQLRPGGLFFFTTGNTDEVKDLSSWGYVRPVGHIVYYNKRSASILLSTCGLTPYPRELMSLGWKKKFIGALRWFFASLGLRTGELPVGIRNSSIVEPNVTH